MLAHIRNGDIIRKYQDGKGRVSLANGDTVSPPVAGYVNGDDKIVPVVEEVTDTSKTEHTTQTVAEKVEADRVLRTVTITDKSMEELRTKTRIPRHKFAIAAATAGHITEAEAEDWAAGVAIPAWVSDAIESAVTSGDIPASERLAVRIAVRTQTEIGRMDRLIPILAAAAGLSDADVDALFGIA